MSTDAPVNCPHCGKPMTRENVLGVAVDVCREHGVWLDKGELEEVLRRKPRRRNRRLFQRRHSTYKEGVVEGRIQGMLLGFWSLFLS